MASKGPPVPDVPVAELQALEALATPMAGPGTWTWTRDVIARMLRAWPHRPIWWTVFRSDWWPAPRVLPGLPTHLLSHLGGLLGRGAGDPAEGFAVLAAIGADLHLLPRASLPEWIAAVVPEQSPEQIARAWVWSLAYGELCRRLLRYRSRAAALAIALARVSDPRCRHCGTLTVAARLGTRRCPRCGLWRLSVDLLGRAREAVVRRRPSLAARAARERRRAAGVEGLARVALEILVLRRWSGRRRQRVASRDCPACGRGTVTPEAPRCAACGVAIPPDQFEPQWHQRQSAPAALRRPRGRHEDALLLRAIAPRRQRELLALLDAGVPPRELAALMGLAPSTIGTLLQRLRKKI